MSDEPSEAGGTWVAKGEPLSVKPSTRRKKSTHGKADAVGPSPGQLHAAAEQLGVDPAQYAAHIALLSPQEAEDEVARVLSGPTTDRFQDTNLVYGDIGQLVFIPEQRAKDLAAVQNAWWRSATWGEFRKAMEARGIQVEFLGEFGYPDDYPADDAPLTDDEKHEYTGDGDWPPWPAAEMLEWVPEDIAEMGEEGLSMVSGPALFFQSEQEAELVAAFEKHGFRCRRDDRLVWATYESED